MNRVVVSALLLVASARLGRAPVSGCSGSLILGDRIGIVRIFLIGRHPTIGVGEGRVYLFDPRHRGNSFGLSDEAYARVPKLTAAGLVRLPRSTTIKEILVTGDTTRLPMER